METISPKLSQVIPKSREIVTVLSKITEEVNSKYRAIINHNPGEVNKLKLLSITNRKFREINDISLLLIKKFVINKYMFMKKI